MATQHQQRKRGASFRFEYADLVHCGYDAAAAASGTSKGSGSTESLTVRRSPTLQSSGEFLIPTKLPELQDRLTVVLDLDETLVYARKGPLYVRPGVEALMAFLAENCETIVWTSSLHQYADAVVTHIDNSRAIQHVIYRHARWCRGSSATKDLKLLGRDLDKTIIIENTPDCIVGYENHGVLVDDYDGGELEDYTLTRLLELLKDLVHQHQQSGITVPEYIQSTSRVRLRELPSDTGATVKCYCLQPLDQDPEDHHELAYGKALAALRPQLSHFTRSHTMKAKMGQTRRRHDAHKILIC